MQMKVKAFFLSLFTFLLSTSLVSAAPVSMDSVIDHYLKQAGYPSDVIIQLDSEQKSQLYSEKAEFVSNKRMFENLKENLSDETNQASLSSNNTNDIITPLALSNFTQSLLVSQVASSTPGKVDFILDYNWDWNDAPFFTFTDAFGIAWTDEFDAYPSSARYAYKAFGWLERPSVNWGCARRSETAGGNINGYEKYDPGKGIGWEVNLISRWFTSNCGDYVVDRHKGWGQVKIGKFHNGSGNGESSSAVARYFHSQITGSGELQFSTTGPAITLTGTLSYDTSPDFATHWDWYHRNY